MPRLLGERVIPSSVQAQRRRVRERLMDMREPIRQQREDLIPGPNLIGTAERRARNLRDRFVARDSVLSRIAEMRQNNDNDEENDNNNSNEENNPSRGRSGNNYVA